MPNRINEPETTQPDADEPDEFSALTDDELIVESRRQRDIIAQLIADGADIDPQLLIDADARNEHFIRSVAAEKQARENLRQSTEALNNSADAILASPLTDKMKPFFPGLKAVQKFKGN